MAWLVLCLEQECGWTARDETEALAKNWMDFHESTHPGHRISITWATWEEKTRELGQPAGDRPRPADVVKSGMHDRAPRTNSARPHGTILVVENSPYLTGRIVYVLRGAGYATLQAPTAMEGLQLAAEVQPDLILLALGLPDMDGIAASRLLREDPATASIPIMAMEVGEVDPADAQKHGWAGHLQKPVSNEVLLPLVAAILPRSAKTEMA